LARIGTPLSLKIEWNHERYVPAVGSNGVINRPFAYKVLHIEELAHHSGGGGKSWLQLMQFMDSGSCPIKYIDASQWGSDSEGDSYYFPVIITSNQSPLSLLTPLKYLIDKKRPS
jgi:hypothetical protein